MIWRAIRWRLCRAPCFHFCSRPSAVRCGATTAGAGGGSKTARRRRSSLDFEVHLGAALLYGALQSAPRGAQVRPLFCACCGEDPANKGDASGACACGCGCEPPDAPALVVPRSLGVFALRLLKVCLPVTKLVQVKVHEGSGAAQVHKVSHLAVETTARRARCGCPLITSQLRVVGPILPRSRSRRGGLRSLHHT